MPSLPAVTLPAVTLPAVTFPTLPPGAVLYAPGAPVDDLLAEFAFLLKRRGFRIGGVVQRNIGAGEDCAQRMELVDIAAEGGDGVVDISQHLGSGSSSCRVDPAGVAEASVAVRRAVDARVDLLVVNKFSSLEKDGGGLADEMLLAMSEGIPLLTSVGGRFLSEWHRFTGHTSRLLPPTLTGLWRWWGPHHLYADLLQAVRATPDEAVRGIYHSGPWLLLHSAGGAGLARLPAGTEVPEVAVLADYAGRGLHALAGLITSWDGFATVLAIAAINAALNRPAYLPADMRVPEASGLVNGLDALVPEGGRLVVVGGFPDLATRLPQAQVIEMVPQPGQYPAAAADWLLPGCDGAVLTAAALPNRTLPRLLALAEGARIVVTGPGTPLTSRLFAYGVDTLAGLLIEDPEGLAAAFAAGGPLERFRRFGRRVALRAPRPSC